MILKRFAIRKPDGHLGESLTIEDAKRKFETMRDQKMPCILVELVPLRECVLSTMVIDHTTKEKA